MTVHASDCTCDVYGCQLRRKGIMLSAAASATMRARRPFRKLERPSWEAGRAGERRRDGSFMPYMNERGRPIHVKEYGERRRELSEARARQIAGSPLQE